jgi:hypothetical protein
MNSGFGLVVAAMALAAGAGRLTLDHLTTTRRMRSCELSEEARSMRWRGDPKPGRRRVVTGDSPFGSGRYIAWAAAIVAFAAALVVLGWRPTLSLTLLSVGGVCLAAAVVVWLRRRMDLPPATSEICSVCKKPKPRRLRALWDNESALDAWWRECPECHAHFCEDHKGLLWKTTNGETTLVCSSAAASGKSVSAWVGDYLGHRPPR